MFENYEKVIMCINELIDFLGSKKIYAECKSHLENDYLLALEYYDNYKKNNIDKLQDVEARSAFVGLYELYKWIWSVKDCKEFYKLDKHLELLIQAAPRINSYTKMLNPVTGKQDDKTNKFVEAIIGMFAIKIGDRIDLDDPKKSSGGDNPDILFNFFDRRIAFACKTPRGDSIETLIDNLKSASKQIERAACDYGFVVINAMNITDHNKITNEIFEEIITPTSLIIYNIDMKYKAIAKVAESEIKEIFAGSKTKPIVLTLIHSATRINSIHGNLLTSLKTTNATIFCGSDGLSECDDILLSSLNLFVHGDL